MEWGHGGCWASTNCDSERGWSGWGREFIYRHGFGLLAVELDSSLLTAFRHSYQDRAGGSTRTRDLAGLGVRLNWKKPV